MIKRFVVVAVVLIATTVVYADEVCYTDCYYIGTDQHCVTTCYED